MDWRHELPQPPAAHSMRMALGPQPASVVFPRPSPAWGLGPPALRNRPSPTSTWRSARRLLSVRFFHGSIPVIGVSGRGQRPAPLQTPQTCSRVEESEAVTRQDHPAGNACPGLAAFRYGPISGDTDAWKEGVELFESRCCRRSSPSQGELPPPSWPLLSGFARSDTVHIEL